MDAWHVWSLRPESLQPKNNGSRKAGFATQAMQELPASAEVGDTLHQASEDVSKRRRNCSCTGSLMRGRATGLSEKQNSGKPLIRTGSIIENQSPAGLAGCRPRPSR